MEFAAQAIGFGASALMVGSFQCRSRKNLLIMWLCSTILWSVHYAMMGAWTGFAMEMLLVLRNGLQFAKGDWASKKGTMWAIMAAVVIMTVFSWKNAFSLLPMAALLASTFAVYSGKNDVIKRFQLFCVSPCWLAYNIYVFSLAGTVCEVLNMVSVILYFLRTPTAHLPGAGKKRLIFSAFKKKS